MPEVSIIIAAYNVGSYLRECLNSVLSQTFQGIQVIVVNDGSTDGLVPVIIKEYTEIDHRVIAVDKSNGGLSDARNAGMKVATGKYLAFLDGDDTYKPTFISTMLNKAKEEKCDLVCCNYDYVWKDDSKKPVEKNFLNSLPLDLNKEEATIAFLRQEIIGNVGIKLYRREICERFGIWFPKGQNWEDLTFTFEFLTHCKKVGIVKNSLHNYLQTEDSITRRKDSLGILDIIKSAHGCVNLCTELYPGKYDKEKSAFFSRAFIILLVYSYKCRDRKIREKLREELLKENKYVSYSLLTLSEKMLIALYRMDYNFSRFVFLKIYKPNQAI